MTTITEVLGEAGVFAANVPGYQPRAAQIAMAEAVEKTLGEHTALVVEAGTGTGKTYAYLVPALLSDQKVIISTGTRNLQDQLFHRDLPSVRKLLKSQVPVALLKGRRNYLCPYRLAQSLQSPDGFETQLAASDLQRVAKWANKTQLGDIAELVEIAEDSPVWPLVTSTAENCLGQDCPKVNECPLMQARARASEASIVVVNHHLFFADKALRASGFGELLPDADAVIFDEAHQIPEVAAAFFGRSLSTRQLQDLVADACREIAEAGGDIAAAHTLKVELDQRLADFRLHFDEGAYKGVWADVAQREGMPAAISAVALNLAAWVDHLGLLTAHSKGLESCHRRAEALQIDFDELTGDTPERQVHWFETTRRGVQIHLTPLDVARDFSDLMAEAAKSWVFTSATLAVGEDFRHFREQLGLPESIHTVQLPSPFAYEQQALFYVPRGLPDPAAMDYTEHVLRTVAPLLRASRGRAFMLFTSHRALREAAEKLPQWVDCELLVQGTLPKAELLRQFVSKDNCVLLATGAFWEGVDVRGQALSLVIIDKLPFASPSDPVLAARMEAIKQRGQQPFWVYQLPSAIIAMKQGAGRLIRDVHDTGVLVVCDPRLVARPYGQLFLRSLPPMRRTRELASVEAFFQFMNQLEPA